MVLVDLDEIEIKKFENSVYDVAFEIEMNMGIDISPMIKSEKQYEYYGSIPFIGMCGKRL